MHVLSTNMSLTGCSRSTDIDGGPPTDTEGAKGQVRDRTGKRQGWCGRPFLRVSESSQNLRSSFLFSIRDPDFILPILYHYVSTSLWTVSRRGQGFTSGVRGTFLLLSLRTLIR